MTLGSANVKRMLGIYAPKPVCRETMVLDCGAYIRLAGAAAALEQGLWAEGARV